MNGSSPRSTLQRRAEGGRPMNGSSREAHSGGGPRVAPAIVEQRCRRRLMGRDERRGACRRHAAARSKAPPCCAPRFARRSATGFSGARLMGSSAGAQPRPLRRRVLRGSLGRSRREGARGKSRKRHVASLYEANSKRPSLPNPSFRHRSLRRPFRERSEPAMSAANRVGEVGRERLVAAEHPPAAGRGSLPLSLSSGVDAA